MATDSKRPTISIDLRKNTLRIFRQTLRTINSPESIILLVNPEKQTLAIMQSNRSDLRAYRIPQSQRSGKQAFEIISKSLLRNLLNMCDNWQDKQLYHIYGESITDEGIVYFNLREAVIIEDTIRG